MTPIYADIRLIKSDKRIVLCTFDYTGEEQETLYNDSYLIKQIPGKRWDIQSKRWHLPLSWPACIVLRAQFKDRLVVSERLAAWSRLRRYDIDQANALTEVTALDGPSLFEDADNDHTGKLFPFQVPGRDFLVTARKALLGDEMGSGKTFQTISALRVIEQQAGDYEQGAYPALIVCPNTLKRNWEREIKRWLPEANPFVIHGAAPKRVKQLKEAAEADNAVIIVNIEAAKLHSRLSAYGTNALKKCAECDPKAGTPDLKPSACETHPKELNAIPFQVCVLDEAHRVKDPNALQTRAIWNVFHGETVRYRWALTGTPIANHVGDFWSVLHLIDPDAFPTKTAFLDRYAIKEFNHFGAMQIRGLNPDHKAEFEELVKPYMRRMLKAQVLQSLPDKVFMRRDVEMKPKQMKAYIDIASQLVTVLDDGTVLVANGSLPGATRLLQFASAYCEIDRTNPKHDEEDPATWSVKLTEPCPKVDELMAIIEDNPGKPLVIAAEHRQLIDLAAKRLGDNNIRFAMVTGGISADERDAAVQAFQSGKIDYILFTYKAGGVGLNLTRADTMVRLQRSWSLIDNAQGVDRVHRIGSEVHDSITIIDLVTAGTIEETQLERLMEKAERLEEIVRDREKLAALGQSTEALEAEQMRLETADLMEG